MNLNIFQRLAGRVIIIAVSLLISPFLRAEVLVGFSPEGSAQQLVISTLASAKSSICLLGYSFTSPDVVSTLMDAKRRGVDVNVVLDEKGNRSKASIAAMNLLVNAGIEVKTVSRYPILHDKVAVIDGVTTQTGSFNYSRAAQRNSENVVVMRNMPEVAQIYLQHCQQRRSQGQAWQSTY
ncbi:phospholipase D family protein [Yersinia ruckeri]|uniref:phospholipase D family nuclease n=1 Tax=Yersinia ruckeri TaxID=29486 RepID=UPI001F223A56|nr:phospholipase D family protein [Yersinia ruckeri]UIN02554.1 phospholipase D family protein [Yersinia ruckeri]